MDFRTHRPQRGFGRSERSLAKTCRGPDPVPHQSPAVTDYDTLHLSSRQRETLASLLVEFAEDLSHDIGIWRSLEAYNRDFFGTPLPCVLQPDETMDAEPINPERMQFLLWTLYAELEPGLILAPNHQDLERLALWIAEFLSARLARLRYDSAVKTFLTTPHTYGWDVKESSSGWDSIPISSACRVRTTCVTMVGPPTFPPWMISCAKKPPTGLGWVSLIFWRQPWT